MGVALRRNNIGTRWAIPRHDGSIASVEISNSSTKHSMRHPGYRCHFRVVVMFFPSRQYRRVTVPKVTILLTCSIASLPIHGVLSAIAEATSSEGTGGASSSSRTWSCSTVNVDHRIVRITPHRDLGRTQVILSFTSWGPPWHRAPKEELPLAWAREQGLKDLEVGAVQNWRPLR